jgi:hypothetical protein
MTENGKREDKTKQRTKKGAEIPVPKRADFMKALRKVSKASPTRPRPKK